MPIIPIKRREPMTNINEMTREELNAFRYHKAKFEYNQAEAMDLLNLVRKYINQNQPSCFSCGNALRDTKTAANEFLMAFGDEIEARLNAEENPEVKEVTERIVTIKKDGKKGSKK
jgi:hypothetical protein